MTTNAKSLLEIMKEKNEEFIRKLKEEGPRIGIIYLVNGNLHYDSVKYNDEQGTTEAEGERTFSDTHAHMWMLSLAPLYKYERKFDWLHFPRARIFYKLPNPESATQKEKEGYFILCGDKCILSNQKLVNEILDELNLPENTELTNNEHYQCAECS